MIEQQEEETNWGDQQIEKELGVGDYYSTDQALHPPPCTLHIQNYYDNLVAFEELLMHMSHSLDEGDPLRHKIISYLEPHSNNLLARKMRQVEELVEELREAKTDILIKEAQLKGKKVANEIINKELSSAPAKVNHPEEDNLKLRAEIQQIYQQIDVIEQDLKQLGKLPKVNLESEVFKTLFQLSQQNQQLSNDLQQKRKECETQLKNLQSLRSRSYKTASSLHKEGVVQFVNFNLRTKRFHERQQERSVAVERKFHIEERVTPWRVYVVIPLLLVVVHLGWRLL